MQWSSEMDRFERAAYWVGCGDETAEHLYLTFADMRENISQHRYIAAFDSCGEWVTEAKVMEDEITGGCELTMDY